MTAMPQQPSRLDGLDAWVCAHNPDPSLSYGKGWWDGVEFIRFLRDRLGLEAVDVPATYLMDTPPPRETLLMPVYRIRHQGMECYLKTDFGVLPPNWFLSMRTPERLGQTYGLFDPSRDWRREPQYLDGFREAWRYAPFAESPTCFTCAVESEMDVYMLIRLLLGTLGESGSSTRLPLHRYVPLQAKVPQS
jgi:hypothetical protein